MMLSALQDEQRNWQRYPITGALPAPVPPHEEVPC